MKVIPPKSILRNTSLAILISLIVSFSFAWKPTTHVYLALQALEDAQDGYITLHSVNYATGEILGVIGEYPVDPLILNAIRYYPAQYRAGILGPDAYPDILTGQQVIHPGNANQWFEYLWERAQSESDAVKAFVLGYMTHAAGDMYGHTFINFFSGGAFTISPPEGPLNAIKHIVLEGYVDKRLDSTNMNGDFFEVSIRGVEDFIYTYMVDAKPGTYLGERLLPENGPGTEYSVPRIYSSLRENLAEDVREYYADKAAYDREFDDCDALDFTCSMTVILAEKAAYMLVNAIPTTYKEAWIEDIDTGLREWPKVSHEVAKALFFNPSRSADTTRATDLLEEYALIHLTSMSGAPDFIGITVAVMGEIISAITPDFMLQPIEELKEELLNTLLEEAIGMDKDELKQYLTNPEHHFDAVMGQGSGFTTDLASFNRDFLKLNDSAYRNPTESFDYRSFPAAYNTVTINKLMFLNKAQINQVLADLGSEQELIFENVMLGFIQSLDSDNQWHMGMSFAGDCFTYMQVFMKQAGEKNPCLTLGFIPDFTSFTPSPLLFPTEQKTNTIAKGLGADVFQTPESITAPQSPSMVDMTNITTITKESSDGTTTIPQITGLGDTVKLAVPTTPGIEIIADDVKKIDINVLQPVEVVEQDFSVRLNVKGFLCRSEQEGTVDMYIKLFERLRLLDTISINQLRLNGAFFIEKEYRVSDTFIAELWQPRPSGDVMIASKELSIKSNNGRHSLIFTEDDPRCALEVTRNE